jgi:hypothetical protein
LRHGLYIAQAGLELVILLPPHLIPNAGIKVLK